MVRIPLSPPRAKYLIYITFFPSNECEFLRTFRGFAARAATARFAQRRIFCRSRAFATARLSCAFVVVRQSLAESVFSHGQAEHANERPVLRGRSHWVWFTSVTPILAAP